jgi:hypothetical protein
LLAASGCGRARNKRDDFASSAFPHSDQTVTAPDSGASASGSAKAFLANDEIGLSATDHVDVAAALLDFRSVEPEKLSLARARLWLLRRVGWGWSSLREHAAKIAAEESSAVFWLKVEHEGHDVAILVATDGRLSTVKPESLDRAAKRLARSSEEATRVLQVLGSERPRDASFARSPQGEREVVNNGLVEPEWPDSKTLKEGEFVRGSAFTLFRVQGTYYLRPSLVKDLDQAVEKLDRARSNVVQRSYLRARDRIEKATSSAELPETLSARPQPVFLVLPSWMALEVERKAAELDCSRTEVIVAALVWGLPEIAK